MTYIILARRSKYHPLGRKIAPVRDSKGALLTFATREEAEREVEFYFLDAIRTRHLKYSVATLEGLPESAR